MSAMYVSTRERVLFCSPRRRRLVVVVVVVIISAVILVSGDGVTRLMRLTEFDSEVIVTDRQTG